MRKKRNQSACIEKISCPDCTIQPNTHLQTYLNEDKSLGITWYTSFCHGPCHEAKGDPYQDSVAPKAVIKSPQQIARETNEVVACAIFAPKLPYRGIPPEFYRSWGCRTLISEYDGKTPYAIAFPYSDYGKLSGWKCRPFHKKDFYALGRTADADPMGLERALRVLEDTLWMTEGEFDAVALDYCMTMYTGKRVHPVVSLTAGGGSIEKNLDYIESRIKRKIKYLVLVVDDDEVGRLAEIDAKELWGAMVKIVRKPKGSKDANDAVLNKQAKLMGKLAIEFNKN